ncbi:alpha/beta fold hydrolase [uncultured Enterovirga sp.]|uniref:alpha/beta fold hydrolase n=1 Tax=uncultured Enterovirga sp. TaxID=2026352 RepID=UPI0035C98A32
MATALGKWLGIAAGVSATAVAGAVAYGRYGLPQQFPLPPALPGERRVMSRRAGPLSYYVSGSGAPLLLIHSVNAAASAYEVRPLFEALCAERRVYAVDLPGFGFSDRSDRSYKLGLYIDALHDMVDEIAADSGLGAIDALALSLSGEFLGRAAVGRPEAFRTLCLVTPTGFEHGADARRGPNGTGREVRGLHATLSVPVWSRGLYNLLVTRPSIRFFLEKTWGSKHIDEGLLAYDYLTTHQPGAQHAPYAFVSGKLFSGDIRTIYEQIERPVLLLHGTRGEFQDFAEADWIEDRPNWRRVALDAGALAHFEVLPDMLRHYRRFLANPPGEAAQSSSSPSRSPRP